MDGGHHKIMNIYAANLASKWMVARNKIQPSFIYHKHKLPASTPIQVLYFISCPNGGFEDCLSVCLTGWRFSWDVYDYCELSFSHRAKDVHLVFHFK